MEKGSRMKTIEIQTKTGSEYYVFTLSQVKDGWRWLCYSPTEYAPIMSFAHSEYRVVLCSMIDQAIAFHCNCYLILPD
jgi:hypothetical protein